MNKKVLVLGGIIVDKYIISEFPNRGEDTLIQEQFDRVAGCALNVAITLKNLGMIPLVVSAVGNDTRGADIQRYAEKIGLSQKFLFHTNKPSGYCITFLEPSGERSFMTYRGSEEIFTKEMKESVLTEDFSCLYLTGYFLLNETYSSEKLDLLKRLKKRGTTILFDPGAFVDKLPVDLLLAVLELSQVVTPNRLEMKKMERLLNIEESYPIWSLKKGATMVIIKNGKEPFDIYTQAEHHTMTPYPAKVVDTTGAGDSFAGGLIYGLMHKFSTEDCMKYAGACGALTTTYKEPHGTFTLDEIENIIVKKGVKR